MRVNSIWLLYFVNAFQSSILYNLLPYVTSEFESHSLLNVIYIVASAMSAATYIPLSKILDVWGRAEGFLIMATFATLGLILMATCHNLSTFCAAYVRSSALPFQARRGKDANSWLLGVLQHWLRRHDLLCGRDHSRRIQIEEPRIGLRLHILAVYDYGIRWSEGIGRFLRKYQLEMGIWHVCNYLPHRGCPSIRFAEGQP